jgi:hypothetical protein
MAMLAASNSRDIVPKKQNLFNSVNSSVCRSEFASGSAFASNKNEDPDPHQSDMLDPESHQFADDKAKRMDYESI